MLSDRVVKERMSEKRTVMVFWTLSPNFTWTILSFSRSFRNSCGTYFLKASFKEATFWTSANSLRFKRRTKARQSVSMMNNAHLCIKDYMKGKQCSQMLRREGKASIRTSTISMRCRRHRDLPQYDGL